MQVCKYASMRVCIYAGMQVYTCLYKKLNKMKDRARPYPRLRDFFMYIIFYKIFFICFLLWFIKITKIV